MRPQGEAQIAKAIMATASFCAIIGFLAHGVIDFGWRLPANVFFAMTLLALCVASLESNERKDSSPDCSTATGEIRQAMG